MDPADQLNEAIELYDKKVFTKLLASIYAARAIVEWGKCPNFDGLPEWLKEELKSIVLEYRKAGYWGMLSSGGLEDLTEVGKKLSEILDSNVVDEK